MLERASLAAYIDLIASTRVHEAAWNAALIAVSVSASLVLLSFATAWIVLRSRIRFAWTLDILAMIPLGVPPMMTGVALVFVAFSIHFIPVYGTIWLIAIGHIIHFLPVASRMMQSGLLQLSADLEDAASVAGASISLIARKILFPLLLPTIVAMIIWILVHSIREFSIAVMLQSGHNTVLSTLLFNFWQTGSPERAAALAVLLMVLLLALVGFFSIVTSNERDI